MRDNRGYTLFEIMLVLGIIAVLSGSAIFMLVGNLDIAKENRAEADIKTLTMQLRTYEMRNYRMPSTAQGLQALVTKPSGDPKPTNWHQLLESLPLDPWGNPYVYRNPGKTSPKGFDLFSVGADGIESEDDIGRIKK